MSIRLCFKIYVKRLRRQLQAGLLTQLNPASQTHIEVDGIRTNTAVARGARRTIIREFRRADRRSAQFVKFVAVFAGMETAARMVLASGRIVMETEPPKENGRCNPASLTRTFRNPLSRCPGSSISQKVRPAAGSFFRQHHSTIDFAGVAPAS